MEKRLQLKDLSTITPMECISEHLLWSLILFINYKNLLFIALDGMSVEESKPILILCMILASIIGSIIRWRKFMTTTGAISDVLIGIGAYSVLIYKAYYRHWLIVLTVAFLIITFLYTCFLFTRKDRGQFLTQIRRGRRKTFIIKRRVFRALNFSGLVLGVIMLLFMVPITYNRVVHGGIIIANSAHDDLKGFDNNYTENEYSLTCNIDSISKIRNEETWRPLSSIEKLAVLQNICNCETNYWGMDFKITIVMDDLRENTLGYYCDSEKLIVIDKQHLENDAPEEILTTTLHESFHAWEWALSRLYLRADNSQKSLRVFRHCDEYIKEMANYQDGGSDYESFMRYYCQYMEADSREYARTTVREYYDEIDEILEEQARNMVTGGTIDE